MTSVESDVVSYEGDSRPSNPTPRRCKEFDTPVMTSTGSFTPEQIASRASNPTPTRQRTGNTRKNRYHCHFPVLEERMEQITQMVAERPIQRRPEEHLMWEMLHPNQISMTDCQITPHRNIGKE